MIKLFAVLVLAAVAVSGCGGHQGAGTEPIETDSSGEARPLAELLANDLEVSRHCYDIAQQNDPDRTGDLLRAPVYFALADMQKALRRAGVQVADPVFASATEACFDGASAYVKGKSRP